MKSFNKAKALGCLALGLAMAFGSVLPVPTPSPTPVEANQSEIYDFDEQRYYGSIDMDAICLNSDVSLEGTVHYTYHLDQDGNQVFDSIDRLDTYLVGENYKQYLYNWWPEYGDSYGYILSPDGRTATIRLFGNLYNRISGTEESIVRVFSIQID